jgi:RNA polymerase sigma factor (sigma-70 family)
MHAEQTFLRNLPLVETIVAATARRNRLTKEEAEDFASMVKLKLIANDYQVLREFQGRSSLGGYLTAVIQRAYIDHCNHLWGKWRPSAEAKRLGPLAVKLDTLLHRDGLTLDEACAMAAPEDRSEMRRMAARLPARVRRRIDGAEGLERLPSGDESPEDILLAGERAMAATGIETALADAVAQLPSEDRLLLRLRLEDGVSLAAMARSLGDDARQLYRRWENMLRKLRAILEQRGYDAGQVAWALDERSTSGREDTAPRPSHGMG